MARIKHIALASKNPEKTRDFYVDVLGLRNVRSIDQPKYKGFILSDGHINLAIIDFHTDDVAGAERGASFQGLHHIGVQIDASERIPERLAEAGYAPRDDINRALGIEQGAGTFDATHEFKFGGPDDVVIDISSTGLEGTDGHLGGEGR